MLTAAIEIPKTADLKIWHCDLAFKQGWWEKPKQAIEYCSVSTKDLCDRYRQERKLYLKNDRVSGQILAGSLSAEVED